MHQKTTNQLVGLFGKVSLVIHLTITVLQFPSRPPTQPLSIINTIDSRFPKKSEWFGNSPSRENVCLLALHQVKAFTEYVFFSFQTMKYAQEN